MNDDDDDGAKASEDAIEATIKRAVRKFIIICCLHCYLYYVGMIWVRFGLLSAELFQLMNCRRGLEVVSRYGEVES